MADYIEEALSAVAEALSSTDKLERVRNAVRQLRDLEAQKTELEDELIEIKRKITDLTERELVKLFSEAHISSLSLDAEGNLPAIVAEKGTYYSAKIPEEKELEAFNWLHANGHGDLVKSEIKLTFGMGERDQAEEVEVTLAQKGVDYTSKLQVHPSTLKSFVKHEIEAGHAIPMELLGAYAGETVKIKAKKGK